DRQNGKLHFDATSDSAIVCGLIALLLRVYSDRTPEDILNTPPDFIKQIGLNEHLSPTRSNGLHAMLKQVFAVAEAAKDS
ncbi:MAG: SufE family protein, partial [Alphaproteobacteria bacterium]|nr:SufE family protein [Alphaproteobacteria bacterium]